MTADLPKLAEETSEHTHILKVMLVSDDCHAYWRNVDQTLPIATRAATAFAQRWFGAKSEARVQNLVKVISSRFDAYPSALSLLHAWGTVPPDIRPLICHWHTQLSDPIYRRFSGVYLPDRRMSGLTQVDRDLVARWVQGQFPGRWTPITCLKFASNMLSVAHEAGLVAQRRDPRDLVRPKVPDLAIAYLLYLLRGIQFEGTLLDNPYLRSVGLGEETLVQRLRTVPGIGYHSLGGAHDVEWQFNDLQDWGRHTQEVAA